MTTTKLFDRLLTPVFCAGLLWVFTLCGKGATASAADIPQPTQESSLARQEFYCSPGYGLAECQQHVSKLKSLLAQYSGGTQLPWSWYIVRSEDWEPLLQKAHLGRLTPAFTGLEGRKTYLEESLFLPPSKRGNELEHDFGVPFDKLLSLAVAHELGHAVCRDGSEAVANKVAEQLRSGKRPQCGEARKSLSGIEEMYLHSLLQPRHQGSD